MTKSIKYLAVGALIGANITAGMFAAVLYFCGRQWVVDMFR